MSDPIKEALIATLEELVPTPADQWEEDVDKVITLPSGNVAKLREPAFQMHVLLNTFPPHLRAITEKHIADKKEWGQAENQQLLDWLICESFVEPRVSLAKKTGCLHISRISDRDKGAVVFALNLQRYVR
jgi:hypothetical protein